MSEIIERVAKAMAVVDKMDEGRWEYLIPHARAAIEAMREPTEEMREAARYYLGAGFCVDPQYQAMIDAALSGEASEVTPDR